MNILRSSTLMLLLAGLSLGYPQDAAEDVSLTETAEPVYDTVVEESVPEYEEAAPSEPPPVYDDLEDEEYVEPNVDYNVLPEFLSEGQVIPVEEGGSVELPCVVDKEALHVPIIKKLAKDGDKREPLFFVGDIKVQRDRRLSINEGVMTLNKVRLADAGDYSCYFESDPIVEITHTIDVQYPPTLTGHSEDQRVVRGDSIELNCTATGNPKPIILWSRVDGRLPSSLHEEEMLSMTLEDVDRHAEGTYTCKADNGIGSPVSTDIHVAVEYEPEIVTEKAIVVHAEGAVLDIVCIVYSRPIAEVTWEHDGEATELDPEIKEMDGGHRHAIAVPLDDEAHYGEYTCTAVNAHGNASESVFISAEPTEPEITSEPQGVEENSFVLNWHSESYTPILEYNITYVSTEVVDIESNETGLVELGVFSPAEAKSHGIKHSMHHKLLDLTPGTEYEVMVQVSNQFSWSLTTSFTFSTKAATTTTSTTTSTTTTMAPTTLKLEPNAATVASKSTHKKPGRTSGSSIPSISVFLLLASTLLLQA